MSSPAGRFEHPVTQAVAGMHALLDELSAAGLWGLADGEVTEHLVGLERVGARLDAAVLAATREADTRGLATAAGAASTAIWLRDKLCIDPGEARRRLKTSRAFDDCTATGEALAAGEINAEHAQAITAAIRKVAPKLPAPERVESETRLLDFARVAEPERVRKLGKYLASRADPDGPEPREREARRARALHIRDLFDGTQRITATVSDLDAAKVKAAIDPLAAPRPAADGIRDERTPAQRRHDAFMEIINRALDHGDVPKTRGEAPHLIITAGLDLLLGLKGAPPASTATGELVSAEMLRKLACDAGITRVLTGPDSMPLDVGRKHRVATNAQFTALRIRDIGCTGPNCDRPAAWTRAHHMTHWAHDGETNLNDLALVCDHCHDRTTAQRPSVTTHPHGKGTTGGTPAWARWASSSSFPLPGWTSTRSPSSTITGEQPTSSTPGSELTGSQLIRARLCCADGNDDPAHLAGRVGERAGRVTGLRAGEWQRVSSADTRARRGCGGPRRRWSG